MLRYVNKSANSSKLIGASRALAVLRPNARTAAPSTIPPKTKCAIVDHHGEKFTVKEIPTPEPAKGQVLVKIHASGVCHTDVHAVDGDWPVS